MVNVAKCVSRACTRLFFCAALAALVSPLQAQRTSDRPEGLRDNTPRWHAITGARLVLAPGREIDKGVLVMRDGIIVAAGRDVPVPAGARVWNLEGRTVYAGFIDLASTIGLPPSLRAVPAPMPMWGRGSELPPRPAKETPAPVARALAARNAAVRAEQDVAQQLEFKKDELENTRELGFTTVLVTPQAGVFRGQSALINLHDDKHTKALVLAPRAAQHVAHEFERGPAWSYPNSLMGAIALIRQTLYDARWQAAAPDPQTAGDLERREANASLEALAPLLARRQPLIYAAVDELDFQRIAAVRDEFKLRVVAFGNGYEYRRAAQLRADALPVIVPLAFPKPPEVENPDHALDTPLQALQHWEQAPSNPALLERAGVEFAVTAFGLEKAQKDFWPRVREAVLRGWSPQQALASLTTIPARLIGEQTRLGALERGRIANVVVASGDLFTNEDAVVELLFVDGVPFTTKAYDRFDPRGTWSVTSAGQTSSWRIGGTAAKPTLSIEGAECDLNVERRQVVVHLPCGKSASGATVTIVAEGRQATLRGTSQKTDDPLQPWAATRTARFEPPPPKPISERPPAPGAEYPAGAFGIAAPPRPSALLVRNATVWTSAAAGRIEQADLLVRAGKIAAVGRNVQAPADTMVIDATGKHVTPGIVDPHSHMAMAYGFNEFSSSITAETRVGDIIDPTDIALYRALAGGATTANILHGSANTIGGQAQVIKLRWGSDAAGLKFEGAMPGIKFALGENVKGSNFGDGKRYPQTRSGVEQIMRDAFAAARAYQRKAEQFRKDPKSAAPRRDLQLDALLEVLEGKRVVHIHSYRADEILMFARLAAEFGIKVGAFHHALEAYKVAEAVAGIGAGVASFSDWWAFKMEAYDAIPTNGAILHRNGVLTSFKSDSDEVVRRLNIEAAKAVKYGGLSETEALAFVTINPARQLQIDGRIGSLEPGKDADFVIWSGHPLSAYSRAEQTWIEGRRYFDLSTDATLRANAERERARLLAKALPARRAAMREAAEGERKDDDDKDDDKAKPPTIGDTLRYLELQSWLHYARRHRNSYWGGSPWHECTEDAP